MLSHLKDSSASEWGQAASPQQATAKYPDAQSSSFTTPSSSFQQTLNHWSAKLNNMPLERNMEGGSEKYSSVYVTANMDFQLV